MVKPAFLLALILLTQNQNWAQKSEYYQSKIANLGDIQLQYMDFGGSGPSLIWIQDFHNYFEGPYRDSSFYPLLKELTADFQVLAPIRRGYGQSSNTNWGYDVATQAKDLLCFMDALGIKQAILYGRVIAAQDMTWIAEHHPDRVLGLIYDGNPILLAGCDDPAVLTFVKNWSVLATDFDRDKQQAVSFSRLAWRPHFLNDSSYRIDIPALRFIDPSSNWPNPNLGVLESGFLAQWIKEDIPGREEEVSYLRRLLQDSLRLEHLHQSLIRCDQSAAIEKGMQAAFGKQLQTIVVPERNFAKDGPSAYLRWKLPYILSFKESLKN